jgi:pimeloyl-ACP methyl ester carboxylesterase
MTPDGVRLAYATTGKGPPLVRTGNWFTHLEKDLESPIWRHVVEGLSQSRTLVRYDIRGTGLSDRKVDRITLDDFVEDLGTVVDAAGLDRFPLLGISQGCAMSVAYAARNPDRVTHLVLFGGYARGIGHRDGPGQGRAGVEAVCTIIRQGWGTDDPSWRQLFTSQLLPEGTPEQIAWFNELERVSASPEVAERIVRALADFDVRELARQVRVPALVLHCRGDVRVPIEAGMELAGLIPGAKFVALDSKNHLILQHEPAVEKFFEEVAAFLGDEKPKSLGRAARRATHSVGHATRKFEASTLYKLLAIVAAIASIVGLIISLR